MNSRNNWAKIFSLLFIGAIVATIFRIMGLIFLSNAASYVASFLAMAFFLYLALSTQLQRLKKFVREHRAIAGVIAADLVIRTLATVIVFPAIFPSTPLYGLMGNISTLLMHTFGFFIAMPILLAVIMLPYYFSYRVCVERNRNPLKGIVATFIGWPFTPVILWLALKTRNPQTKQLY